MIRPKKKGRLLPLLFYVLTAVLLISAFISLVACHQNISAQLAQGVTVKGNELAILNLYPSSCVQYFALAALLFFCGLQCGKISSVKVETLDEALLPYAKGKQYDMKSLVPANDEPSNEADGESDFSGWNSK